MFSKFKLFKSPSSRTRESQSESQSQSQSAVNKEAQNSSTPKTNQNHSASSLRTNPQSQSLQQQQQQQQQQPRSYIPHSYIPHSYSPLNEEEESFTNRRRSATCPSSIDTSTSSNNLQAYTNITTNTTTSNSNSNYTNSNNINSNINTNTSNLRRRRLNSREIPRTYSGLYGIGGETEPSFLLPFELERNFNTNWLHSYPDADLHRNNTNHLRNNITSSSLLWVYIFFILFVEFALVVLPLPILQSHVEFSFTITNVLHGIITVIFLHWLKGSPNFYDHGELNALTLWEQLCCSPDSNILAYQTKQVLYIIPTLLCYVSCKFVNFDVYISALNLGVWIICIVAKCEGMHGVRLFGFNKTIGIDDEFRVRNNGSGGATSGVSGGASVSARNDTMNTRSNSSNGNNTNNGTGSSAGSHNDSNSGSNSGSNNDSGTKQGGRRRNNNKHEKSR